MAYQAHRIADRLYQGGYPPPGPALARAGIDVVVLCAKEWQDESRDSYPGVTVIRAGGEDHASESRLAMYIDTWKRAARQVVDHVNDGKNVLVTCMAGQNRSGLVVSLALRELTGMRGADIVSHVQRSRPFALNNDTFARYIEDSFK